MTSDNIKWFKEIDDSQMSLIGYKAARQAELVRGNFPVPRGFVINSQAYYTFIQENKLKDKIYDILKTINYNDRKDIEEKSNKIRELFMKGKLSQEFTADLEKMYNKLGETSIGWLNSKVDEFTAIRASVIADNISQKDAEFIEDNCGALNVKGIKEIVNTIKDSWATMFSADVLEQEFKKEIDPERVCMGIIIERMINAKQSGIMITSKDIGDDQNLIIEAISGFGGAMVIKELSPDHFEIKKKTMDVVNKSKSSQEWELKRMQGKTIKENIPEAERGKAKIDTRTAKDVATIGKKLELHFGTPLFVEWVIEKAEIFILRADPLDPKLKKIKTKKKGATVMPEGVIQERLDTFKKEQVLEGIPVSDGVANGVVRIVKSKIDLDGIDENTILVASATNMEMTSALKVVAGIITNTGSTICHAALMAKKNNKPCVVNTVNATTILRDGQKVQVNGKSGKVYLVSGISEEQEETKQSALSFTPGNKDKKSRLFSETITKIIVKINSIEDVEELLLPDIDGVSLSIKGIISDDELESIKAEPSLVEFIKERLKIIFKAVPGKDVYYKINFHKDNLAEEDTSSYEIESIIDLNNLNASFNIAIENVRSIDEIRHLKEIIDTTKNKIGLVVDDLEKLAVIEQYAKEGIDFIIFNSDKIINNDNLKLIAEMCKSNKVMRIVSLNNEQSYSDIKTYIGLGVNELIISKSRMEIKDSLYKHEKDLLKSLLSI